MAEGVESRSRQWPDATDYWQLTIGLLVLVVLMATGLAIHSWFALRHEQEAVAALENDVSVKCSFDNDTLSIDLSQVQRGRLYKPVLRVSIDDTDLHQNVFNHLSRFSHLQNLWLQNCRINAALEFDLPQSLSNLKLPGTRITNRQLNSMGQLKKLDYLWLDGTGLRGDWLQPLAALPKLESLLLKNGDLSDGASQSLARMTGLRMLQLSGGKIDHSLGPAVGRLKQLENLVIVDVPFDDDDMKHLAGLKSLEAIYVGNTAITDRGMSALASMSQLWRLSIRNTRVGDQGIQQIAQLPRLKGIDMFGTLATNACLQSLAAMPMLEMCLVENTRISTSSKGFVGVLKDSGCWYPNETKAKEAQE